MQRSVLLCERSLPDVQRQFLILFIDMEGMDAIIDMDATVCTKMDMAHVDHVHVHEHVTLYITSYYSKFVLYRSRG